MLFGAVGLMVMVVLGVAIALELRTVRREAKAQGRLDNSVDKYRKDMWRHHDYKRGGTPT